MPRDEFDLIAHYFRRVTQDRSDVIVGSGDDCAVLSAPPSGKQLIMTIDSFLADRHFLRSISARDIAYKAVAISLSDIAAMGGEAAWLLAALSIESVDENWFALFSQGLFEICDEYHVSLVGGDLTQGPLSVTTQVTGFVQTGAALCRDGARVGDKIYVTGTLGDAALALLHQLGKMNLNENIQNQVYPRLLRPTPRLQAGRVLSQLASSCIDISDGLMQDLGHIISKSGVGAIVDVHALPISSALNQLGNSTAWDLALTAGDDYELCFTIAPAREAELLARQQELGVQVTCIGEVVAKQGIELRPSVELSNAGFQHFSGA